jgi:hypothetical protein
MRAEVERILDGRGNVPEARLALQRVLRETCYEPEAGAEGTILDFGTRDWQGLVIETNVAAARGYRQMLAANDPETLDTWPALKLIRAEEREHPRGNAVYPPGSAGSIGWTERWREAAKKSGDNNALEVFERTGRMVALKSSDIWNKLGNLWEDSVGNPYPPFAFNSGMDIEEVPVEDARELGLMEKREPVRSQSGVRPPRLIPIEDVGLTEYLWSQPVECGHCGETKPLKLLSRCDSCFVSVCDDCRC